MTVVGRLVVVHPTDPNYRRLERNWHRIKTRPSVRSLNFQRRVNNNPQFMTFASNFDGVLARSALYEACEQDREEFGDDVSCICHAGAALPGPAPAV